MTLSKTGPIGIFNIFSPNPNIMAHNGGNKAILRIAFLTVPPNLITKTNERIKKMHIVAISQKIALKNPSWPKIPKVTGYPINAVLAIITVTSTLHNFLSSYPNLFNIKNEITPVTNDEIRMTTGKIPNLGINDKSDENSAEKIMHGNKIFITILFKGLMSFSDKKSMRLRTYPIAIIKMIDKIVTSISFINNNLNSII